jgi:hypothetical protein
MQAPLVARSPAAEHEDASAPLELRLRHIHQRRRKESIRRLASVAFWSFGLLAATAFVLALTLGVVQT